MEPILPIEAFGLASPYASAKRNGDEVTISWKAVRDVGGRDPRLPDQGEVLPGRAAASPQDTFIPMTYEENVGTSRTRSLMKAAAREASDIRMISYARRGFAFYYQIK